MRITPEMVERGARALLALHGGQEAAENYPKMPPHIRERWASRARAVLEAVSKAMTAQATDDMVERAAKHLYLAYILHNPMLPAAYARDFDRLGETTKSRWRQLARETLNVGLGGDADADNR